ncbi:TonB-dependent receptor [Asticcacaulis solisilvae]|uniref:TonB-dependent receptor n=1 Tax=Asticcacaulis solisilvae TaxID=1217274 RepID=UPI003FD79F6A
MGHKGTLRLALLASAATIAVSGAAFAQTDTGTGAKTNSDVVVVTGMRKSMRDALATKRAEPGVVEVVSSKDIGVLPDVTIAETLARLPGLNTTRDRGNDSQAAIRGLGPRMVLGLINGREMASSEPDRNVRWEIFPSEVVSGVEVYKSSEARLVSGGVSGTVDIQTIRPLDYRGPSLTLRAGLVSYDGGSSLPNYDTMGYRASGAYVTKLTPTLGWVVAASIQKQKNGYENVMGGGWNNQAPGPVVPGGSDVQNPWGASFEEKAIDTERSSISSSLQWKPTDSFEGRFDILKSDIDIEENGDGGWYTDWGNWGGYETGTATNPGFTNNVIQNGALVATQMTFDSTYHPYVSKYSQIMKLLATGLNGKWRTGDWTVTADAAWSQAERYGVWKAVEMWNNAGKGSYDYRGSHPSVTVQTSAWDAAQAGQLFANTGQADVSHLKDTLGTANLDFDRHLNGTFWSSLKFGARLSDRTKLDTEPTTVARVDPLSWTAPVSASLLTPWNYKNFTVPTFVAGDFDTLAKAVYGTAGAAAINPDFKHQAFVSKVHEQVAEAYVESTYASTFAGKPVDGNVGVRVVSVKSDSTGPSNGTNVTVGNSYTKVLPSALARFTVNDGAYLKLGVSETLSRPPLNDLRVDRSYNVTTVPYSGGGGNPLLKPYLADQVDVSYENYFRKDGLFAVAAFAKNIHNYIGYDTRNIVPTGVVIPGPQTTIPFTSPYNRDKNGTLAGLEITYQTPFYFVPMLEKFGVYSNIAFTASNIHESSPSDNPYPMNGVAKTTATLDLWYADDRFESRLGFKYHTPFTLLYTWSSSALTAVRSELTLDYSASYKINDQISVRFQAGNLLNTPLRSYVNNNPSEIERTDYYGRRFLVDLTMKY